jgi:putative phage-type endonuclease
MTGLVIGSLGASRLHEVIAKTKSGYGASRAKVMSDLIIERLTGAAPERYVSAAMEHGIQTEAEARSAYEFITGNAVVQVEPVPHPSIKGTHASPDGLVGNEGILEIKCPESATHIETILSLSIPAKYITQMHWQMICTGRIWGDFVSYDPRMPADMRFFHQRIGLTHKFTLAPDELESEVTYFLAELNEKLDALKAHFRKEAA